ncbi:hypothetical protein D3C81_1925120 [compost metagenome]
MHTMSSRSIDDPGRVVTFEQRNSLLGRVIRQAQDRNIGRAQIVSAQVLVATLGFRDGNNFKIVALGKAAADLQTCGAVFAVDEDFRFHALCLWISESYANIRNQFLSCLNQFLSSIYRRRAFCSARSPR